MRIAAKSLAVFYGANASAARKPWRVRKMTHQDCFNPLTMLSLATDEAQLCEPHGAALQRATFDGKLTRCILPQPHSLFVQGD
ncbi:MAG TPA: hypothetical protein VEI25_03240 [Paraburkholderia sp.]|nr:hypothetical protein [Paraburkholderia sp.]